jgi:predicted HicB family RNase H-like nuclease
MAERDDEVWVQLATRVPKTLHRQLKLECVETDESVMDFVVAALRDKLKRESGRKRAKG